MIEVPEVTDVDIAFGGKAMEILPDYDSIPDEFKDWNDRSPWLKVVDRWFFEGLDKSVEFVPKEGVNAEKAFKAIYACIGSFAPKHEHKTAGCAMLLSEWFEEIRDKDGILASHKG